MASLARPVLGDQLRARVEHPPDPPARDGRGWHAPRVGRSRRATLGRPGRCARRRRRPTPERHSSACGPSSPDGTRSTSTGGNATVGSCHVLIDPCGDGRQRFAEAIARIPPNEPVNEATITEALYSPADCEPDLIVILGEPNRLPPSLVWELAYGEFVFHPLQWDELEADHLVGRDRRLRSARASLRRPRRMIASRSARRR